MTNALVFLYDQFLLNLWEKQNYIDIYMDNKGKK